ncbi:hypothetical protein M9H77_27643 [Catharanthus roseus]|uniref:Uncharacterized protein n=1 Tax=Catharanthus roseus TaxID=4058 RepID=A0ACC0AEZ1_CATRO|nr:hypothetical protein M9H77_27643 [Catharanthus roseus]
MKATHMNSSLFFILFLVLFSWMPADQVEARKQSREILGSHYHECYCNAFMDNCKRCGLVCVVQDSCLFPPNCFPTMSCGKKRHN